MSIFESVFKLSKEVLENAKDVTIDYDYINDKGKDLILATDLPITKLQIDTKEIRKLILKELTLDSINYCYWYGSCNFRFNNAGATKASELLNNSFIDYSRSDPACDDFSVCIDKFKHELLENRFPLLEERFRHLNEVEINGESFADAIFLYREEKVTFDFIVENMLQYFPGFASDLFLKRAALFFINLYRVAGLFEKNLSQLPVAADYQLPKVLEYYGFIKYSEELKNIINKEILIPKGSRFEIEIRAATVLACQKLCEVTNLNIAQIDIFFWGSRNITKTPFHLCATTDY